VEEGKAFISTMLRIYHETEERMRILIKNATIIDGTNTNSYMGNIFIENKRIAAIGDLNFIDESIALNVKVINAAGLIVSPGFIDTHSHSDLKALTEPDVLPKLMQGITTEVLGQDGISMAPLPIPYIKAWRKNLAGLDGESNEINWEYETTKNYLSMLEQAKPALNESYLLPHGNVRMEAMGLEDREPSEEEIKKMCEITRREMQSGCLGLSSGLIYMPCAYSNTRELIEICKVVAEYDGVFVVHQRSEADTIIESMKEIIQIGKQSGVRIHFSHFKVCGKKNWKYLDEMLDLLESAQKEGITVSLDQYPYVAGSTMLSVILPPWVHDGGTDQLVERLKSKELRERMKQDIKNEIPGWDNFIDFAGVEGIYVTSVATDQNKDAVGLSLLQLGELRNKEPLEAAFDLLLEEENAVGMVDFYGLEEHVIKIMKRRETNICTDGLLSGTPHPRVYGSFPRVLGKYLREEKVLTIEEAVHKMTGKAAAALNIKERGFLKAGYYADITIWNPDTIIDKGTFENPKQYPDGIAYVIVNGEIAVENGKYTKNRSGMVIRRSVTVEQ
jgi:N-acyl-D-amino-acid deacylase